MYKFWKSVILSSLLLVSMLGFAQDKELVVWHSYRGLEKEALTKLVDAYNAQASGHKVKPLAVPYDAYADKVTAAVPRGKGPDVFIFAQDRLGGWIEAGNTVEPLDFYLEDDTADQFLSNTMEAMTYRDSVYGLPFNYKFIVMIYNKALVKNPPKTTGELMQIAKAHTNAGAGKYGLVYSYADFFYHASLMNGFGGRVFDKNTTPVLNNAENIKSVELMMNWFKTQGVMPAEPSTALVTSLFNKGNAAIVFNGPWFLGEIDESVDYGLAPLPSIDEAGNTPMRPWMTVEGMYIAGPSKHKDEAFEFIQFATSVKGAEIMASHGRQTPANKAVYELPNIKNDEVLSIFVASSVNAVPMPNVPEMTMVWSPATTAMNKIVKGTADAKTALTEAQEKVEESVARLRKSN